MKKQSSFHSKSLWVLMLISIFFAQCKNDTPPKQADPAFTGYISAVTGGIVSNQAKIKIRLTEAYSSAEPKPLIEKNLFDFSPNIDGEAYWLDNQTIEFRPSANLPVGKLFEAEFFLSKLLKVPSKLKTFTFQFQVMKQAIDVEYTGMEAYDNNDLTRQMISGGILTYDYADMESLEESISAQQNGNDLFIRWNHGVGGKSHSFIIDSINRTENHQQVILQWNGKKLGFEGSDEKVFDIPPLGDFKVLNISISQQPQQLVTIYFSDPISQDQDLEGLVYLKSGSGHRLVRETNAIKLYPTSNLKGAVKLVVTDGIRNRMGYQLMETFESEITFTSIKPAIKIIGKGVILPSSNGLVFPFKTVNLSAVNIKVVKVFEKNIAQFFQINRLDEKRELKRVGRLVYKGEIPLKSEKPIDYGSWNNFSIDLSTLIEADPGAIYRVILSCTKQQSLYACNDENVEDETEYKDDYLNDAYFDDVDNLWYFYDYDDDYYYNDNYHYSERNNPCKPSYYMIGERTVAKNILASNLGIIAKSGQGTTMMVAVTDIITTQPLADVEVDLYNFQKQLISSGVTDADGFLEIDLKKKPFLLIAKKGDDRGYLRLDDGSALSLSMFDVSGQKTKKGVKGILYGERGVWRPGDSLFLTFLLEDKAHVLPESHPVVFELYTPQHQLYKRIVKTTSLNGFYNFQTLTAADAPTGNWLAKVKLGGSVFTKTLKIESIKPNRLKIKLDFHDEYLSDVKKAKGDLEVKWLHGAIAGGLKVDIELNLRKSFTVFKKFKDYSFDDPSKEFDAQEKMIFEGDVDADGKAVVNPNFQVQENAPGMLRAYFKIRAFEKGGDFSVDRFSMPFSPYRGYVGLKMPKGSGWNGALYSNEPNIIPIVTVDENGKPVDRKGVKIEVYDVYWRWWWERSSDDDLARYVANRSRNLIHTATINTKDGKALYELNLDSDYYGRKFIRVIDPVTGHSAGESFYVTYKGWRNKGGDSPGGAEMLSFSTDKTNYQVGETITVNIPTAQQGRMLVSLQTGSKILNTFWVDMAEGKNSFQVESTAEMTPNVYFNLTLIQPHNNVKNDLPIRLYGVQSVKVENPESHLEPKIAMPSTLAPEEKFTVKVSETNGRKMTYTIAVVDDGLLDLTRFKTPDLWKHFNAKEALSVHSWDMYKYVIGAFSGKMAGLLALGGDESAADDGGAKANRFKPVVTFLGPFELDDNKENEHHILMPNYVGSVRTMVVAANNAAYGYAEKTTAVKKPLMVLASLPRVLGPGEKVVLPVTVFAMDKKIKDVVVTVESNHLLQVEGEAKKTIQFSREGDQLVNFHLLVAENLGIGKVVVTVESGSEKASYELELDVRAPNPMITDVVGAIIEPGETWQSDYSPIGMAGTNNGVVEISSMPPLNLQKRLQYLIQYPHGCIEQTTSAVFPQLFLDNLLDLKQKEKQEIEENIKAAINKLRSFQIHSGGFSYWPGNSDQASDWGTSYAGHFMLEAKAKGYSLPPTMLSNWIGFQKQRANAWTSDMGYYSMSGNQLIQAYRLYTLALAKAPVLGAMNRMKNINNLSLAARWRLAAAYYLVGKKQVAENLIKNQSISVESYKEFSYSYGSAVRDKAMILETLVLLDNKQDAKVVLDELAKDMSSNRWYSTQTTAYTLLAVAKFIGITGSADEPISYEYIIDTKSEKKVESDAPLTQFNLDVSGAKSGKIMVKNTSNKTLFVKMQLEGIPFAGDKTNAENSLRMKVRYLSLNGEEINPKSLNQGQDFMAEVQISHPGLRDDYKEMALTQIFPSGWEIRNMRMDEMSSSRQADQPKYQDIRDDRVLSYFDIKRGETKTFRVLLNASYLGEFYLPTVYCEAMYDHEINARKAGEWVGIVLP